MKYSFIAGITKEIFDKERINFVMSTIRGAFEFSNVKEYELVLSYMYRKNEDIVEFQNFCVNNNYKYSFIPYPKDGFFSKSIQYNAGIRNSFGKYIISGDADICWRKDTVDSIEKVLDKNFNTMIGSCFVYLKEGYMNYKEIVEGNIPSDQIVFYQKDARLFPWYYGNFQGFPRTIFFECRGYDERMRGWGEDDNDLFLRFKPKLELYCLPDYSNFHIHHNFRNTKTSLNFDDQRRLNLTYREEGTFLKNDPNWGTILSQGWNQINPEQGGPNV